MSGLTNELKQKCETIAHKAGAKLTWTIDSGCGRYTPKTNKNFVGINGNVNDIISIFCHELGHWKNYLSGSYYKYHHLSYRKLLQSFETKEALATYCLHAEIYTETIGKELCAVHFPEIVYNTYYHDDKASYDRVYDKCDDVVRSVS